MRRPPNDVVYTTVYDVRCTCACSTAIVYVWVAMCECDCVWSFARRVPVPVPVHIVNAISYLCSSRLSSTTENIATVLDLWASNARHYPFHLSSSPTPGTGCLNWLCVYLVHAIESFSLRSALSKCLFTSSPCVSTWNSKTYLFLINFRWFERVKFGRKTNASWMQPHKCMEAMQGAHGVTDTNPSSF